MPKFEGKLSGASELAPGAVSCAGAVAVADAAPEAPPAGIVPEPHTEAK